MPENQCAIYINFERTKLTHGERGVEIFREREEEAYRGSSYILLRGCA